MGAILSLPVHLTGRRLPSGTTIAVPALWGVCAKAYSSRVNRSAFLFRVRQFGAFVFGVWVLLLAARAVGWATGLDGTPMIVLMGVFAVAGVATGIAWARDVESSPAGGQSASTRWGTALGVLLAVVAGYVAAKLVG